MGVFPKQKTIRCKICFCSYTESCGKSHGLAWIPTWITKIVAKYNAQFPHKQQDLAYINADPSLSYSQHLHDNSTHIGQINQIWNIKAGDIVYKQGDA